MDKQQLLHEVAELERQYMAASYNAEADSPEEFHAVGIAYGLELALKLIKELGK